MALVSDLDVTTQGQYAADVRRGALTIAPLWAGAVPFAVALAIAARAAGFSPLETIAMSAFVFAGAAQVATVSLHAGGAGMVSIAFTVFVLNLRHVLYGLSLDQHLPERTTPPRPLLAFVLTDESYGIAIGGRSGDVQHVDAWYFGAAASLYIVFVLATAGGVMLGSALPDTATLGLDFLVTLMFAILLVPLLRTQLSLGVAALSGVVSLALSLVAEAGVAVLAAPRLGVGGPDVAPRMIGVWAAAVVMLRWPKLWAALLAGMGAFWLSGWWLT